MRHAALCLLTFSMLAAMPAIAEPDCVAFLADDETDLDQLVDAGRITSYNVCYTKLLRASLCAANSISSYRPVRY